MSLFDRALLTVSPSLARRRAENRLAFHAIEGARADLSYDAARRGSGDGWVAVNSGPNAIGAADGPRSRAAARDVVRNTPTGSRAVDLLSNHIVGTGFQPRMSNIAEARRNAQLDVWKHFTRSCDPEGLWRFHAKARLAVTAMIEGGFSFLHYRPGPSVDAPLLVEVLEADYLDMTRHGDTTDGGVIFHGIEFDRFGARTGYWLFDQHPGEAQRLRTLPVSRFVPASQVDPVLRPRRPGEVVPATWFAPAVETMRDRKDYLTSERMRMKVQACLAMIVRGAQPGAIEGLKGSGQPGSPSALGGGPVGPLQDADGRRIEGMSPGLIAYLNGPADISMVEPRGATALTDFVRVSDHDIAAAFSVPHFMLTGDLSQVNFASAQIGLIQFHAMLDCWQSDIVEPLIYARAWARAMEAAKTLGALSGYDEPDWAAPQRHYADIVKAAKAQQQEVEAGFRSVQDVIRTRGGDPAEVLRERAEWEAATRSPEASDNTGGGAE